jgi:mono/diheme cytochrome c family protein
MKMKWPAAIALCALSQAGWGAGTDIDQGYPPKDSGEASVYRGSIVFQNYCVTCHGVNADGKGRAAKLYDPKPANLRVSPYNDQYKELIIRGGGERVGRSKFMPPWGQELTDEQIGDVVSFLRSISISAMQQQ